MVLSKNGAWAITLAVGAFIMISLMLYITVDSNAKRRASSYKGIIAGEDLELQRLRERVENLKNRAEDNRQMLNKLNEKIVNVISEPKENGPVAGEEMDQEKQQQNQQQIPAPAENKFENFCPSDDIILSHNASGDVQMLNVYDIIPFDNEDGGVWKQGWPIEYDKAKIMQEKRLEVIVVPHSHNDPGWLKTFEGYFEDQTRHILDYMVTHLDGKLDLSFIYAEMSFFELWWSQQNEETKKKVKSFLQRGQLEIVTGGWVMTDEANSHYFSTIMELFEGHEFLKNQMNYVPKNHWSIDPFGLSPTLAYILNRANLSNMVIQRVHYSVKKYLAKTKQLEFIWRQLFAGNAKNTDIITHMFPFYSYDAPHSCGPDPMVCCQFDFRRMHGQINCPWGKSPLPITEENVGERAELLADQYRKKAQLYGFNTILIPLGDDFRYEINTEWTEQYANYKKLFDYMNNNEHLNIHARFGTLADYFELLHKRLEEAEIERENQKEEGKLRHSIVQQNAKSSLPILSGDFFTYADRDDHYWSGYFTSRPFYKHMDRSLQHYLRAADILFTLANWKGKMPTELMSKYNDLVDARRSLSLFQHHDGVTGTAKTAVMMDYGQKMAKALTYSKQIIANSAQFLMNIPSNIAGENGGGGLRVDEEHFVNRLPEKFTAEDGSTLVVANTLGQSRKEVICANVNDIKSRINGQKIQQQIGPIFYVDLDGNLAHYLDKFELCFLAELPPFGLVRFDIIKSEDLSHKVKIFSSGKFESNVFEVKTIDGDKEAKISNSNMDVMIDSTTGLIKSIRKEKGGPNLDLELSFVRYGARQRNPARRDGGDSLSGAYLFLPDGPATELPTYQNVYVIAKGSIREFLYLKGPAEVDIRHQISLDINSEFVSLQNKVNLAQQNGIDRGNRDQSTNYELAMRIRVPSIGGDNFFTDLNGFQMIRRRRQPKLPLQAHFYPMPGAAFIQDSQFRVSMLGRQALGAASLQSGEMQIMLDRRLIQDDDRGLGQGVEDNVQTESRFHLFVEQFTAKSTQRPNDTIAFHSMAAHHTSLALHYPPILLFGQLDHAASSEVPPTFSGLKRPFPCDMHPVAFRTLSQPTVYPDSSHPMSTTNSAHTSPKREAALVLHRFGIECTIESTISNLICLPESMESGGKIDLPTFFHQSPASIHRGSLTLLHIEEEDKKQKNTIKMDPMELATMKIEF